MNPQTAHLAAEPSDAGIDNASVRRIDTHLRNLDYDGKLTYVRAVGGKRVGVQDWNKGVYKKGTKLYYAP